MTVKTWIVGISILFIFPANAFADKILMKNGDRLRGTVESVKNGILTLTTDYSETIKIKISQIKKILTSKSNSIHMKSGEILRGRILPGKVDQILIEGSPGRAETALSWDEVEAINPPPNKWHGSISAGASLDTGNTDRLVGSVAADAERRFENDRVGFHFLTRYAEEDEKVTARNTYGDMKFSHFFSDHWYVYLGMELLSDTFKDLHLRTTIGPGMGYQVWEDDIKDLSLEGGISYFSEDRITSPDKQFATARFAANYSHKLNSHITFTDQFVIFPSLENTGEYTLRNEAGVHTQLGSGWKLKLANIWERDSDPSPGVKNDDLQWLLSLGYAF
jgi:putative salt-induced outer membrane protein YdiY